ncbi:Protein indeterminate-domain 11 [Glycine soja]
MSIRFVLSNLIAKAVWTTRSMSGANKKMIEALTARKKEEYLKNPELGRHQQFFLFICKNKGFQRDHNLQLHKRGHNLPWKLKQRSSNEIIRKKVYVCPEASCVHYNPSRAKTQAIEQRNKSSKIHNGSGLAAGSECQDTYNKNQAGPEET